MLTALGSTALLLACTAAAPRGGTEVELRELPPLTSPSEQRWQALSAPLVEPVQQQYPSLTYPWGQLQPMPSLAALGARWARQRLQPRAAQLLRAASAPMVVQVAQFMGRTRLRAVERPLIRPEQLRPLYAELRPGDIALEKTNYYLCDYAIDGFWGHSALYLGRFEEAAAAFDTAEVRAYYRGFGFTDWADYVQHDMGAAVQAWRRGDPRNGQPVRVIEGDGVARRTALSSAEQSFDGDHVAFLRPRGLSTLDRARAVAVALGYWNRPYDFAFDLDNDDELVCTELLARAYGEAPGKRGVQFPIEPVFDGRRMIYPNRIAELYAREAGRPDRRFDFVTMLRGDASTGRAAVAGGRGRRE